MNRQSVRFAREDIELSVSTLADQVGACATALEPLHRLIEAHVLAAERLRGDDTRCRSRPRTTGRIWTYVRDALGRKSWPFAGSDKGADRSAVMGTLIQTAKLNDVDP